MKPHPLHSAPYNSEFEPQLRFLNTCVRHGYICRYPQPSLGRLSTPEHSPLEKVGRGGGYLGVLSVISLALLLPTRSLSLSLSLSPHLTSPSSSTRPRAMSQPTFTPEARELGGLPGALLPPLRQPLAHFSPP